MTCSVEIDDSVDSVTEVDCGRWLLRGGWGGKGHFLPR